MSSSPEFTIPARDLDAGGRHFRFPIRASWLRGALEGTDVRPSETDGELDVRASRSATDVVVVGSVAAELVLPCARCLEPARVHVREGVSVLAVQNPSQHGTAGADEEASVDGAELLSFDGETVVLDDLVRDELLLGVPMIPLCSEGCAGIRPERAGDAPAGTPLDARLLPLLGLRQKT
ncbi:MAG TPA: DUF177 domain-containing protein [Polyangiaceae bacterium]|nr:DUF177 domain-containing protein [Polyangiaceae bacterium]